MKKVRFGKTACVALLFCVAFASASQAQTYTAFGDFFESNGNAPTTSALVQGVDGTFYGATTGGGNSNCSDTWQFFTGCGTVFQADPLSTPVLVHAFCSETNCLDGGLGVNVVQATDGNLYGTAYFGGSYGAGALYKISPNGTFALVHSFCSAFYNCAPGYVATPNPIIQTSDGNFYGTTLEGGINGGDICNDAGCGTLFKVTPTGKFTTLYNFCSLANCADGYIPTGSLLQATNGSLYGTTGVGLGFENYPCHSAPCGTVFEMTPAGKFTTLYSFCSEAKCADGGSPTGGLGGCGTIFQITPSGKFTTLYNFCSQENCTDGYIPSAALVQGTDGTFYGTTEYGGIGHCLNSYRYGTGCGVVFNLATGLAPFVEARPGFGKTGTVVTVLGSGLTGTTSVTFNGTSAKFKVVSDTYIEAEVPAGATTGSIEVTTPGGSLASNVVFHVTP